MGESPAPGPRRTNFIMNNVALSVGTQSLRTGMCFACFDVVAFFYCPKIGQMAPPGH